MLKFLVMSETQSTGKYWIFFFLSVIFLIFMLVYDREYFWMALPFVCYFFLQSRKNYLKVPFAFLLIYFNTS